MLPCHGRAEVLVLPQETINYYNRVAARVGGIAATRHFYRF
jgi:hypothetical protein